MENLVPVGQTKKPHGLKGELKLQVEDPFAEDVLDAKVLFLDMRGQFLPHFVEYIRGGGALLLKLEEVDSRETATLLSHKQVFMRPEDLTASEPPTEDAQGGDFARSLVGWKVEDLELGDIGPIVEVREYPQQWMAVVPYRGKEALIPLNEAYISMADENRKVLLLSLPEGLLDLF